MGGGGVMEAIARPVSPDPKREQGKERCGYFEMPLHYPKYTKLDYESMPEWKLDCLFTEYGLPIIGDLQQKRKFAMGAFLWPH